MSSLYLGTAIANYNSVTEGSKIIEQIVNEFGRIDVCSHIRVRGCLIYS